MAKRNAAGAGSIRKKTVMRNGKEYTFWEARVTVGRDPGTGKQLRRSFSGKTQKEVREKMQAAAVAVNDSTYQEPSKLTVSDWLDIWLAEYTGDVKPLTRSTYKNKVESTIKPALGAVKLQALKAPQIQKMLNDLQRGTSGRKPLSAKTVKDIYGILHRALGQAVKLGMLRSNPTNVCDLPKAHRKEIKPMEQAEITRFLQAIQGTKYGLVYQITLFTGLREGEVLGLTWDCIDFQHNAIYINKQLQKTKKVGGTYCLAPTKNSRNRTILTAPSVMALLRKQKSQQAQMRHWQGKRGTIRGIWCLPMSWVVICAIVQSIKSLRQS